jgi:alpha-1,3-rhamnosyl/mannosyltransferase
VLVLTGRSAQREPLLSESIDRLGLRANIRRTGRIPRADVDVLLQRATALTFPSRYEGAGIPVLEAMAAGCPVVASDCTSLPELVADAGVLVGPSDVNAWVDAMNRMIEEPQHRQDFIDRGRVRAEAFSWDHAAAALRRAYGHASAACA